MHSSPNFIVQSVLNESKTACLTVWVSSLVRILSRSGDIINDDVTINKWQLKNYQKPTEHFHAII